MKRLLNLLLISLVLGCWQPLLLRLLTGSLLGTLSS